MPVFTTGQTFDAPSQLSHGWHPAILYGIRTEPIPPYFTRSLQKDTHEWHWHCALWESPQAMAQGEAPELRALSTTRTWTPERVDQKGDKLSASKAYTWTCSLLGRTPEPSEAVTLDDKLPLLVLVDVERKPGSQYIRLKDLMAWPAGASDWPRPAQLPDVRGWVATLPAPIEEPPRPQRAQAISQAAPPPPAPPRVQPPGMQTYAPQAPAPAGWSLPALPGMGRSAYQDDDIPF